MEFPGPVGQAFVDRRCVQASLRVKVIEFATLDELTFERKGGGPGLAGLLRA